MKQRKFTLEEHEIPENWYNIVADMPNKPLPPLNPSTLEPIGPEALAPLFPMALIEQEVSTEKWITIPDEVRNIYSLWRPTPLYRAHGLEKALDTPAKIYYKYEGVNHRVRINQILRFLRLTITNRKGSNALQQKPAQVNGGVHLPLPASTLVSSVTCIW